MNKKILSVVLILCLMLAVMPMTAYAADIAFCTKCNKIQTVRATYQYADDKLHKCSVTCTVCYNKWYYGEAHIWSGTATCTSGRTCTVCGGTSEPLGHDWGTWTQNSDGTLTVRANGEFSKFDYVKVDGKRIDSKNYTAKSGSTIVTLSKDYLATLSVGNHSLTVVFNDGECSTNFTVKAVSDNNPGTAVTPDNTTNNPQTGDHSGIVLAVVVLLVSGGALTVLGIAKKKAGKC